jgi:hypothetical protein
MTERRSDGHPSFVRWSFVFLAACGSSAPIADAGTDAASGADAFAEVGFSIDAAADVGVDAPDITLDAGGPFLCGNCECDGRTHYCYSASGGPSPMPIAGDGGDAATCAEDAGGNPRCVPIPTSCEPTPSCSCVNTNSPCMCSLDPSGNGLDVSCNFP